MIDQQIATNLGFENRRKHPPDLVDCGVVEGESILHEVLLLQAEKVKVMKHNLKKNNTFIVVANLSNMSFDVRKSLQEAVPNISKCFLLKKLAFTVLWFLAMDEIFEL